MADNKPYYMMTPDEQQASIMSGLTVPQSGYSNGIASLTSGNTGGGLPTVQAPGAVTGGGLGDIFSQGMGWLGDNSKGLGSLLQGIGALGSMFQTNQQIGLAKDNLQFQKDSYNTNLNNQITSYNTSLEDKIRGRNAAVDTSESQIQGYLDKNKMSR